MSISIINGSSSETQGITFFLIPPDQIFETLNTVLQRQILVKPLVIKRTQDMIITNVVTQIIQVRKKMHTESGSLEHAVSDALTKMKELKNYKKEPWPELSSQILELYLKNRWNWSYADTTKRNFLHYIAIDQPLTYYHIKMFKLFIGHNVSPFKRDTHGKRAIDLLDKNDPLYKACCDIIKKEWAKKHPPQAKPAIIPAKS